VSDVDRIGEQLNQIIRAVQVLLPRFDLVSEGMAAQSQGADQIRDAMGQLSEGASQTTESLREFNKATEQLREAVLNLKEDISKFTT
jgi:methyl-accepting chemotaxis protein WspA